MAGRLCIIGSLALIIVLGLGSALADTGGSMGGGNWSGGGGGRSSGGGYSSSSSSSSSSRSSYRSSSDSDSGSSGRGIGTGALFGGVAAFLVLGLTIEWATERRARRREEIDAQPVDVSVLRVALDGRARKFVQWELRRIATVANTATPEGRARMLHEVAMLLRKLRDAWIYVGAVNEPMQQLWTAKTTFERHVDSARSKFREELVRNADGATTTRESSGYTPRADEGEGLILVSIIIAAHHELFTVRRIEDGYDLQRALEMASQLSSPQLVAIEIVWQPADENDRMSSMELVAKYPLHELVQLPYALVGKTFCTHCTGPFPAELVTCPHCGAPAPGREPRAA